MNVRLSLPDRAFQCTLTPPSRQSRSVSPLAGGLDLHDLGAEVGELETQHVAGDQA
jgi:hypothetical protein